MLRNNVAKKISFANYAEKIVSNALGKYIPSSTPIIDIDNIEIDPQKAYTVLDKGERGELMYVEIAVNSTQMICEIILYNDRAEPVTVVNKRTFQQLIKLGRGMTPGRVQPSATGQTQDEIGFFMPNMFHIARYKDDQLTDWLDTAEGNENPDRYIVGRIVCQPPMPYSSISIYVKNTTTDSIKKVYSVTVGRTVYETISSSKVEPNPNNIKEMEVIGDEIDDEEDDLATPEMAITNYNAQPMG